MGKVLSILGPALIALSTVAAVEGQNQSGFTPQPPAPASNPSPAARHDAYDPLLDLPPLPRRQVTLIGGTVVSLDEVMNRMVVQPFGGKQKMKVRLDTRTHFYRDGKAVQQRDVQQGQRVYVDTMLNGDKVFAKSIWIQTTADNGIAHGQIVDLAWREG